MTLALSILLAGLWLVLACAFAGVGTLVLGRQGGLEDGWPAAHAAFWTGVGSVTCALMVWHLFLPVNGWAFGVLSVVALAGLVRHRRLFTSCLTDVGKGLKLVLVACFAVWVANHALASGAMDDYLYEFQAIRWDHDFRIVPGLANLHGRLGFNESHHLLGAVLSVGPLAGNVNHVINGLFVTVLVVYLAGGLERLGRPGEVVRGSSLLRALLTGPAIGLTLFGSYGSMISTLKADALVTCCVLLLSCLLVELAEGEWGTARFNRTATVLVVVSAFAVSVKLSAAVFCLVLGAGVCGRLALGAHGWRRPIDRVVWCGLALSVVTVCLVPLRGVVLSGYPAYPATALSANVDWKVPRAQADAERTLITTWARQRPTYDPRELRGWDWVGDWARVTVTSEKFTVVLPLALTLMCLAAAAVRGGASSDFPGPTPPSSSLTPGWSVRHGPCCQRRGAWRVVAGGAGGQVCCRLLLGHRRDQPHLDSRATGVVWPAGCGGGRDGGSRSAGAAVRADRVFPGIPRPVRSGRPGVRLDDGVCDRRPWRRPARRDPRGPGPGAAGRSPVLVLAARAVRRRAGACLARPRFPGGQRTGRLPSCRPADPIRSDSLRDAERTIRDPLAEHTILQPVPGTPRAIPVLRIPHPSAA